MLALLSHVVGRSVLTLAMSALCRCRRNRRRGRLDLDASTGRCTLTLSDPPRLLPKPFLHGGSRYKYLRVYGDPQIHTQCMLFPPELPFLQCVTRPCGRKTPRAIQASWPAWVARPTLLVSTMK